MIVGNVLAWQEMSPSAVQEMSVTGAPVDMQAGLWSR